MDLVTRVKLILLGLGAGPVLWVLLAASVASIATIFERAWFFRRSRVELPELRRLLAQALRPSGEDEARRLLQRSRAPEAAIVLAGLAEVERGAGAAEKAMAAEAVIQRRYLERRLAFLGTLGNNAPFVGLFGTVIGIIEAFDHLGRSGGTSGGGTAAGAAASAGVMSGIAEALVATAVGLAVAIPAVVGFNYFQRQIKARTGTIDALSALLLGQLTSGRVAPGREGA